MDVFGPILMAKRVVYARNPSQVESGSIRWLYCTKSGRQVHVVTGGTRVINNLFLAHRQTRYGVLAELFSVFPHPPAQAEVTHMFRSNGTRPGKWPRRPVGVPGGVGADRVARRPLRTGAA